MDQSTGSSETEPTAQHYIQSAKSPIVAMNTRPTLGREEEELLVADEGAQGTSVPGLLRLHHNFSEPGTPRNDTEVIFSVPKVEHRRQKSYYRRHIHQEKRVKRNGIGVLELFKTTKTAEILAKCLDLAAIYRLFRVSKAFQASNIVKTLKKRRRELILSGLSSETRRNLWYQLSPTVPSLYYSFSNLPNCLQSTILADIRRTNSAEGLTRSEQQRMYRLLNGVYHALPEVGYCQCLVFVTAILVKTCLSEERSFWLLHSILTHYDLSDVISGGFEKLRLLCYQFDCFLNAYMPDIAIKLREADFSADLYALRWLLTLFSYEIQRDSLYVLWDLFFLEKWKVMIRAGLALVQVVNGVKEKTTACELFCLLRSVNGDPSIAQEVLSTMHSFKVTNRLMCQLTSLYDQGVPPTLHLSQSSDGVLHWKQHIDESENWTKMQQLLDETLCMEDLGSPGGPLNVYFQGKDESMIVCSICGSGSHSAVYCDEEDMQLSALI